MEEFIEQPKPVSPVKTALKFGLITGVVLIVFGLIIYYAGFTGNTGMQWVSYIFLAVGLFLGIKTHRDQDLGGYMSYGRAFGTGVLTALFAGVLLAVFTYVFYTLMPDIWDEVKNIQLAAQEKAMYDKGMTDAQIDQTLNMTEKWMSPGFTALVILPGITIAGAIMSLVIAAFLKKPRPLFVDDED